MADLVFDPAAGCAARDPAGTALDQSPNDGEVVARADADGVILFVSPAWRRLGYESEDLVVRYGRRAEGLSPRGRYEPVEVGPQARPQRPWP